MMRLVLCPKTEMPSAPSHGRGEPPNDCGEFMYLRGLCEMLHLMIFWATLGALYVPSACALHMSFQLNSFHQGLVVSPDILFRNLRQVGVTSPLLLP
jgi:hypothetical protein